MSLVVVAGAVLECNHGGRIRLGAGDPRLSVRGNGAVVAGGEGGLSFLAGTPPCPNQTPVGGPAPCTTTPATSGLSRKILVGGRPVLLDSAAGVTVIASVPPAGTWSVTDPGQNVLEER